MIAFVVGRAPLSIAYPFLVARLLGLPHAVRFGAVWRPIVVSVALFAAAWWLRQHSGTPGWVPLMTLGSLTAAGSLAVAYLAGLTGQQRRHLRSRARRVVGRS